MLNGPSLPSLFKRVSMMGEMPHHNH